MRNRAIQNIAFIAILSGLVQACYFPERTLPGVTMMIISPRNGAVLEMGPIDVVALAEIEEDSRFFGSGLGTFKFYVNGEQLAEFPASTPRTYGSMETVWTPAETGEYFLNVVVEIENWEATSAPVRVCIINPVQVEELYSGGIWGYEGPCDDYPSQYPFFELGGYSLTASALPTVIEYEPDGFGPCSSPTITFEATVLDGANFISYIMIEYYVGTSGRGAYNDDRFFLTRSGGVYPEEIYSGTTSSLDELIQNAVAEGGPTELTWTAHAFAADWLHVTSFGPRTIPMEPCHLGVSIMPSPTPLSIIVEPSATPDNLKCEMFSDIPFKLVTLEWKSGSPLTFYFKMPGGVPGLENEVPGDTETWNYSVDWGGQHTDHCEFLPGYEERLYCTIEFPAERANSNQPMELHVNGCATPIYSSPRAEIPDFGGGPVKTDEGSGSEGGGCQPPPAGCGPNSSWFAEPFCTYGPF